MAEGSSLSNAEEIGGVVVKIAGDISDLKAKHAEAKSLSASLASAKPAMVAVAVGGSPSQIATTATQAVAVAQAAVSAKPIVARFDLQEQQVRNRMAGIINDMRAKAAASEINIVARARLFGNESPAQAVAKVQKEIASAVESSGGGVIGDGGGGANSFGLLGRMSGLTRKLAGGMLIYEGLRLAKTAQDLSNDSVLAGNDQRAVFANENKFTAAVESVPLLGQVASLAANYISPAGLQAKATMAAAEDQDKYVATVGESAKVYADLAQHHQLAAAKGEYGHAVAAATIQAEKERSTITETRDKETAAAGQVRNAALVQIDADLPESNLESSILDSKEIRQAREAGKQERQQRITDAYAAYEEKVKKAGTAADKALAAIDPETRQAIQEADEHRQAVSAAAGAGLVAGNLEAGAIEATANHESQTAFADRRAAEKAQLVAKLNNAVLTAPEGSDEQKQAIAARTAALGTQNVGMGAGWSGGTEDRKTAAGQKQLDERNEAEHTQLVASASAARLRAVGDSYGAEMVVFEAAAKTRLAAADASNKLATVEATNAERAALQAQHADQVGREVRSAVESGVMAADRIARDPMKAAQDRLAYESQERIIAAKGDIGKLSAAGYTNRAEKAALDAEQKFQIEQQTQALAVRSEEAGNLINNKGYMNKVIGYDESRIAEIHAASPEMRAAVAKTVIQELEAEKKSLIAVEGGTVGETFSASNFGSLLAEAPGARKRIAQRADELARINADEARATAEGSKKDVTPDIYKLLQDIYAWFQNNPGGAFR